MCFRTRGTPLLIHQITVNIYIPSLLTKKKHEIKLLYFVFFNDFIIYKLDAADVGVKKLVVHTYTSCT
jgi:hypothetical protein